MFWRLLPRAGQADPAVIGRPAAAWRPDPPSPRQVVAREALLGLFHFLGRALEDDLPAAFARPGADLDDLVGRADDRLFVFDDDHGIGPVAEVLDRADQLMDVARVQADRRFVEHVEHVHQAGAEGRGERHAACLAAAEGADRAVERQVAQADRFQVAQPIADLFEHHPPDVPLPIGEFQAAKELGGVADLQRRDLRDVQPADLRGQRLGPQPRPAARRTRPVAPPAAEEHADVHLVLPPLQPREETVQPAEVPLRHAGGDLFQVTRFELRKRHVDRQIAILGQGQQFLELVRIGRAVPRSDRPLADRLARVGNDQVHVDPDHVAEALALGTSPQRAVEAVQPRLGRRIGSWQSSQANCELKPTRRHGRPPIS